VIEKSILYFAGASALCTVAVGIFAAVRAGRRASNLSALQLSGDPAAVASMIQPQPGDDEKTLAAKSASVAAMARALKLDYTFIAFYWLTFSALTIIVAHRHALGYRFAAFAALLTATTTALVDVVENLRTSGILSLSAPGHQIRRQPVAHLRATSRVKWLASSITLALLSLTLLPGSGWPANVAFVFLGVAAAGVVASFRTNLIRLYMLAFVALAVAVGLLFTVWANSIEAQFG
jgi:hypothetical protein